MDRQHRARSVRTVRRAVGVLSVCLLLVAGLVWQGAVRQRPAQSGTVGTSQPATVSAIPSASATPTAAPTEGASAPRPSTTANGSAPSRAEERRAALTKLLDARSAAVAHRDVDAFLATVDPTAADYRTQQTTLFANLRRLDPVVWRYEYGGEHGQVPAGQSAKSGSVGYLVRVQLHYRLGPVDPVDVVRQQWVVARQHAGRWVLAGPGDDVGEGHESDVDAWDLGPVTVARGDASLVVARSGGGSGGPRVRPASSYVEEVDRALRRVAAVWSGPWTGRVVVVVPASQVELARVLGETERDQSEFDQIAAVTTGRVSGETGPPTADRVVLNPALYGDLGALGRRVVLTHEVTHVATRASAQGRLPLWFSEGFADYVGYLGTGVTVEIAAADVLEQVRDGELPTRLPDDEDFNPGRGDIALAYEQSWLAMRMVAATYGQKSLVRLYAAASTATGDDGEAAVDHALREVLDLDRADLLTRWQAYLKRLA